MQEYANEYTTYDCGETREILERMSKVDFSNESVLNRTFEAGRNGSNLKTNHDENCTCSYCDPSAPIFTDQTKERDSMTVGGEDGLLEHGKNCACQYCRTAGYDGLVGALGNVQPETVSLKQFSSKEEEKSYMKQQEEKYMNSPYSKFVKDDIKTDTKSFREMYSVWKKNLAGDLEKEYTVASKKDLEALAKKDIRVARKIKAIEETKTQSVIHSHENHGGNFCESDCCGPDHISHGLLGDFFTSSKKLGEIDDAAYLKNKEAAQAAPCTSAQLKSAIPVISDVGYNRLNMMSRTTKLMLVYVGSIACSPHKWDKLINKFKLTFDELKEEIPQCKIVFVPDMGAKEGQIRVEVHDVS